MSPTGNPNCRLIIKARFDDIELHGANGYLIDQFLHGCTNHRTDEYGGSHKKMTRFCLEVVNECCRRIGNTRVGLRLSPGEHMSEIVTDPYDSDVFKCLLDGLEDFNICYIHAGCFDDKIVYPELGNKRVSMFLR